MKITWRKLEKACDIIANNVIVDDIKFDVIVAIGNSGFIPAVMISKILNIDTIETIIISSYDKNNSRSKPKVKSNNLSNYIKGKKVLCIDDITATGNTYLFAKEEINKFKPKLLKYASPIVSSRVCKIYPDYYGYAIMRKDDDFISLPWDQELV
jgi:hypoxanthine phosphoribosyltransferase